MFKEIFSYEKITAIFTVLLMLAASSAFAAKTGAPAFWNGTSSDLGGANGIVLNVVGMSLNSTANTPTKSIEPIFYGSNNTAQAAAGNKLKITAFNGSATGITGAVSSMHGALYYDNGTAERELGYITGNSNYDWDVSYGNLTSLTRYGANVGTLNATITFVPVSNYQMMIGIANGTLQSAKAAADTTYSIADTGVSMQVMSANGTFAGIESSKDVWDYYAFGQQNSTPVVTVAQVKITSASGNANAQVKYYVNNGTEDNKTSSWIAYNATGMGVNSLKLSTTGYRTLLDNATINHDKTVITGYTTDVDAHSFVVMIKNGSILNRTDLINRGFKSVFVGSKTNKELGNATAGISSLVFDNDLMISQGTVHQQDTRAVGSMSYTDTDLGSYVGGLTTTNEFGLSQSNMTIYQKDGKTIASSFYGKQAADKLFSVGLYEAKDAVSDDASYAKGLMFLIPNSAVTYEVVAAGNGYQNNATLIAGGRLADNSTAYTSKDLKARWTGIASDFTPLTEVKGYTLTVQPVAKGDVYFTAQFKFAGIGGLIKNLDLYKVSTKGTSSWNLPYASNAAPKVDGAWWISNAVSGGYLNENSVLDPSIEYYLNWTVKDNGAYDANSTIANGIVDPVVLGSVPTSSSSSSSGCVFNPSAGFGLEWLLLMLAPMVAIVRSRFKK